MNSRKNFPFLILLISTIFWSLGCRQEIFVAHYGQNSGEKVAGIDIAGQDNYYVTGKIQTTSELFIMRNNRNGVVDWTRTYDLGGFSNPADIISTADGGCIVVGSGFQLMLNAFIVRLDANGQEIWKREFVPFGSSSYLLVKHVIELNNGQIAIVGTLNDNAYIAPVIIKLDANGNNPSYWRYNEFNNYGTDIKQHPATDELILLAESNSINQSLLMSIDPNSGTPNWSTFFPNIDATGLVTMNNEIFVSGGVGSDPFLLQTDLNGNVQWAQQYIIPGTQEHSTLSNGANGNLAISGNISNGNLFLLTMDQSGQPNWYHEYLGIYDFIHTNTTTGKISNTAIQFSDGGYGLAAHDLWTNNNTGTATVIRTNAEGNAPCNQISGIPSRVSFIVGQNPGALTLEPINMSMNTPTNPIAQPSFQRDDECRQGNCTPPPNSLTAWFPLGLNGFDYDLATGNLASLGGGPISGTPGKVGVAYTFDGTNNHLIAPNDPAYDFGTGDFSIDFWVNLGNSASGKQTVVCKMDSRGYCLSFNGNFIELELNDGFTSNTYTSTQGVPTNNQWHFVTVTVDRSSNSGIKYYIDGVLAGTNDPTAVSNSLSNTSNLLIGKHPLQGDFFGAKLDEVELYDKALSDLTIQRIYAADGAGKCSNVAYTPEIVGYCPNQTTVAVGITVCNYSNSQRTYTLQDLSGLPAGANGGSCHVDGPTNYTDPTSSISLNAGNCGVYIVNITRPSGLNIPFNRACYQATFVDNNGNAFWAEGSVMDLSPICLSVEGNGIPLEAVILSPGQSKQVNLALQNNSEQDMRGRIRLADTKTEDLSLSSAVENLDLNDFTIPAGESLEIPVMVKLNKYRPFRKQSLVVETQAKDDQSFQSIREIPVSSQRLGSQNE